MSVEGQIEDCQMFGATATHRPQRRTDTPHLRDAHRPDRLERQQRLARPQWEGVLPPQSGAEGVNAGVERGWSIAG